MRSSAFPHLYYFLFLFIVIGLAGCEGCNDGPDRLHFSNPGNDMIGILIDGRDGNGDFTDRTLLIPASSQYTLSYNLIPRISGDGEVVAFRKGSPPVVLNPVDYQVGQDSIVIPFGAELSLDFTVWVLDTDGPANTFNNRVNETNDGLAYCEERWEEERMGLIIGDVIVNDVRTDSDASTLRDHESADDPVAYFNSLTNLIGFDEDRVNIYLTRKVNGSREFGASFSGGDQIAMGMYTGDLDILFRQMGHLFTLESVDGDPNFNSQNVAKDIGNLLTRRKYFTEGQVFRSHINSNSAINDTYNLRPGAYTNFCDNNANNLTCPPLEKRIWANGNAFPAN